MPDIVIAFFVLGLIAGLLKSDLRVPQSIYETLSIMLMLVLGLKGGMALHGVPLLPILPELALIAATGVALPLLLYPLLRKLVQLNSANAASVAAQLVKARQEQAYAAIARACASGPAAFSPSSSRG